MPLVRSRMTEKPSSLVQAASGGALMGLANLVPGVSGGTMLLVTGIYTEFITAIADVSRLRWRTSSLLFLSAVVGAAAGTIILLAGPTKTLVIEQRWIMYSLFIGLTLGGVPLIWRLAQPVSKSFFVGTGMACALMVLVALGNTAQAGQEQGSLVLLFFAGLAGASAMILPGVSGGYLLLLLGQYVPILSGIEKLKMGLIGAGEETGLNWPVLNEAFSVVVPVGIGVGRRPQPTELSLDAVLIRPVGKDGAEEHRAIDLRGLDLGCADFVQNGPDIGKRGKDPVCARKIKTSRILVRNSNTTHACGFRRLYPARCIF